MIGIIGAMDIELDSVKEHMTDKESEVISGIEFVKGKFCGQDAVTAKCGIGKVFAAICAQTMILRYSPSLIINSGVAGTLSEALSIGDIAIADAAVQHDMDTSALGDEKGLISGINIISLPCDKTFAEKIKACADTLSFNSIIGTVASGDQFICEGEKKARIRDSFSAIACEMEGAAIAHVCYVNKVPCSIIRAISDSADGESEVDYPAFFKSAAEKGYRLLCTLFENM